MQIKNIQTFAHKYLGNDTTSHDYWHGERVANPTKRLFLQDYPKTQEKQLDLLLIMGYSHDTVDEKICASPGEVTSKMKSLLKDENSEQNEVSSILFVLNHMSYSKDIEHHFQLPMTGQYVQDADQTETLGAIGIARAFAFGGSHNRRVYDPATKPQALKGHKQYRNHETTTINHFCEKLFNLEQTMNTSTGRRITQERTIYMYRFVDQFLKKWEGR